MAGRGPAPAKEHTRRSNDKKLIALISDDKLRGPALPVRALGMSGGKPVAWHPMTKRWWNNWRKSPQAIRMMSSPDWDYLLDTAKIHHEFWTTGRWELAAELRLRAGKFGATPEDRARLGFEIATGAATPTPEGTETPSNVSSMDDIRDRLKKQA